MIYLVLFGYLLLLIVAAILYIPKFCQYTGARIKIEHKKASGKRHISLLIPARNESGVIRDLLESVKRQTYDREYFDINIIVKEEDDPTVAMAKEYGARVFVVPEQNCKGDALDGYFKRLKEAEFKSYDAFVIVDADAVLTDNYVEELNNALEYDRQIFVTRKNIKNYLGSKKSRSVVCNCSALTYAIIDDLGNLYRTKKKIPLNFCGQGMMLRREVIEKKGGWAYRSLTEDFELKMDSILQEFTSMYYPYAVIYTEEVLSHKDSKNRRMRWLKGVSQCEKLYGKQVKKKIKAEKASIALRFDYLHYRNSIFIYLVATIVTVVLGIIFTGFYFAGHNLLWKQSLGLLVVLPLAVTYILLWLFSLLAMLCYKDVFEALQKREKVRTLAVAPLFLLEFVPLYIQSRFYEGENSVWEQTKRVEY